MMDTMPKTDVAIEQVSTIAAALRRGNLSNLRNACCVAMSVRMMATRSRDLQLITVSVNLYLAVMGD